MDLGPHVGDRVTVSTRCTLDGVGMRAGEPSLRKGDSFRGHQLRIRTFFNCCVLSPLSPLRLCCTRISLLFATIAAMASLVHPEHYQTERRLDTVRCLLGWSAPSHAQRIRADASPLGDLAAGEFVLFVSYLSCGLVLPISPSSCYYWRSSVSSSSTSHPTPSFRRPSSLTCARCSWGWRRVPLSSAIFLCW